MPEKKFTNLKSWLSRAYDSTSSSCVKWDST
jgi:hypothetical protein